MTAEQWGRVDEDGTVWVRTGEGERAVGQYPGATPEAALAYFARKYDDLLAQVVLLEQRISAGQVSPAEATSGVAKLRTAIAEAHAVGDLDGLAARIAALEPLAAERKAEEDKARQASRAAAVQKRRDLVDEAVTISETDPARMAWKAAGDRLRELFDLWRQLQRETRLDKSTEDELWKRFSHARTVFDRKRRHHFGALDEQRSQARAFKEKLVADAEALSTSTDWVATAGAYRDLMNQWKGAGRASRKDDDTLWARFRAAQDTFFTARNAASEVSDAEFRENLQAKEALLVEAEALVPVRDVRATRSALREIQQRWDAAGRVPRTDAPKVEARMRAVEQAVKDAEQNAWERSNPEARARAQAVVDQLESVIAGLEKDLAKAEAGGNAKKAEQARAALDARQEWLEQARKALTEFGG